YPTLTLYDDYTFEYYENEYSGMTLLTGTYSKFNGQYTMTVKQQKIGDMNTTITYPELLFSELTDDYIILQSQLNMSRIDDILQKDKKPFCFASYFIPDERIMSGDLYTAVHFYTDRSFELDENFMEGIELVYGVYDVEENGYYHFYVTETTNRTGYKYSPLEMQKYTGEGFCLMTDLYCTEKGTVFSMSQWHIGN
ncbi:MAG: hypothetical protein IJM15_04400, partial [Erysipelotrichaceae bacterium]|nr:hypothetical protein [Erysipelotrichaceae bacterium]